MPLSLQSYRKATDYLNSFYAVPLYTHHDIAHPVVFYPAVPDQRINVDSVLGRLPTKTIERESLAIYDYGYLHSLQNSQRHLYNGTTFALHRLKTQPLRIEAAFGAYFDNLATCYALEHELLAASESRYIRLPLRSQYHRDISPKNSLTDGRGRSAAIGGVGLVVFNNGGRYRAIIARRTSAHATRSDAYHLLPAFIFQPMNIPMREGEWSIEHHFYREWLEELFGMAETDRLDFYRHPALLDLLQMQANRQAGLYLSGITVNLLTLRPEICLLLLIHDADWWQRVNAPDSTMRLDVRAETQDNLLLVPIDNDTDLQSALPDNAHLVFVPQGLVALWEGVRLARELMKSS